ncbi:DUF4255 domain-containing protein [Haladaptatus sp. DFWS20]|uniref:DUF4255 domain-containing protein n=1 Tax=Haladaptatus sp. DFWS20 TaxID=3403467 RepID=UPI003EB7AC27
MGGYGVVSDVSKTLAKALSDGMVDPGPPEVILIGKDQVGLASPADASDLSLRLTFYLYQVEENEYMKNGEHRQIDPTLYERPPLALDLYFLLTAHPATGNDGDDDTETHVILGRAMQILQNTTVVTSSDNDEEAYVSLYPQSVDQIANLFPEKGFWPSVPYLVTPVIIEPTEQKTVIPVVERHIGRPEMPTEDGEE